MKKREKEKKKTGIINEKEEKKKEIKEWKELTLHLGVLWFSFEVLVHREKIIDHFKTES